MKFYGLKNKSLTRELSTNMALKVTGGTNGGGIEPPAHKAAEEGATKKSTIAIKG
ncbi:hypothetical protein [Pseudoalteromonas sp. S2755]|uniref:hypothetical protein n=1 Tax=Pseudoalteromonas sp. S2755 TaxID=2066523 RepID=UPI001485CCB1|nr:hypothetical protein [Pseudoalteromonas sp. S2755]